MLISFMVIWQFISARLVSLVIAAASASLLGIAAAYLASLGIQWAPG